MPYPNEHSARLRDPNDFDPDTFRRTDGGTIYGHIKVPKTISIIWGKLKGKTKDSDPVIPQALRFPIKYWTEEKAKKWLKDNGVRYIIFEKATESRNNQGVNMDKFNNKLSTRSIPVVPNTYNPDNHSVQITAVTDNPVQVYDIKQWAIIDEIILIEGVKLPETGQVPLLDSHNYSSVDKILGSGRDFVKNGNQLNANIFFSSSPEGQTAELKVKEGHLTDISIGYEILESVWVEEGTNVNIMGHDFVGPVQVVTSCLIKELSLTPIGADAYAKVRSEVKDEEFKNLENIINNILNKRKDIKMDDNKDKTQIPEPKVPTPEEIRQKELERMNAIDAYGKRFVGRIENINDLMDKAKREGTSIELFKGIIADILSERGEPISSDHKLGLSEHEQKRYSLARLIHAAAMGKRDLAPFEFECSDEVEKKLDLGSAVINRSSISPKATSVWIPHDIMHRRMDVSVRDLKRLADQFNLHRRDLSAGVAGSGGTLIGTNLLASEYIEYPANQPIMKLMGARVLEGLTGNVDIPKKTGKSTFYYVSTEGGAPTESAFTTGKVSLTPKIGGTYTDYTLQLLLQSTPSVDALVQADLLETVDIGIDYGCFHGSNANGEPKGLVNQSAIGTVDGTDLAWEQIIEFLTDVMSGNAMGQSMAFATNPLIWGYLVTRKKDPYVSDFLADINSGKMAGQPLFVSNQIASGYLIFGDFAQAIIGLWGGYNLLVDPYTASSTGTTRVRVLAAHDFGIRLATAFSVASNVS